MQVVDGQLLLDPQLGSLLARDLYAALSSSKGRPVAIDASRVEHLGVQCLQVLLAAVVQWQRDAVEFKFVSTSQEFDAVVEKLGFNASLRGAVAQ